MVAADFLFAGPRPLLKEDYSVSLLGDIHYDCPPIDRFHSKFRRLHAEDGMFAKYQAEFENFSSMWGTEGRSAALVKASGLCRLRDTAFALQLGDLVEGDCESPSLHKRMLAEAYALMKKTYGESIPFVMCRRFAIPLNKIAQLKCEGRITQTAKARRLHKRRTAPLRSPHR